MEHDNVIIFDGVCNLCSASVRFIIDRDPQGIFRFAPLQSATGAALLGKYGMDADDVSTFLLVRNGKPHTKSDAALEIARQLRGGWKALGVLRLVPKSVRDRCYDMIACNRYRWFGKRNTCMLPGDNIRRRFLD